MFWIVKTPASIISFVLQFSWLQKVNLYIKYKLFVICHVCSEDDMLTTLQIKIWWEKEDMLLKLFIYLKQMWSQ